MKIKFFFSKIDIYPVCYYEPHVPAMRFEFIYADNQLNKCLIIK